MGPEDLITGGHSLALMVEYPQYSGLLFLVNPIAVAFPYQLLNTVHHLLLQVHQPDLQTKPHADNVAELNNLVFGADHAADRCGGLLLNEHHANALE